MIATPVACVVDASVGIKLVIAEALSGEAHALFAHLAHDPAARFYVPDLFDIECANILWKQVRRAGYALTNAERNLADLLALAMQRLPVSGLATKALAIAALHGISAYDACYVAASDQLGVPLITADTRLVNTLAGSSYSVMSLGGLTIPPAPLPPP
jgi:predicted nucleic acid-binding protein